MKLLIVFVGVLFYQVSFATDRSCELPLSFPMGTQFRTLALDGLDESQIGASAILFYYQDLRILTKGVLTKPDSVLYLGSGIDGALTHQLFPDADVHITIDPLNLFYGKKDELPKQIGELLEPSGSPIELLLIPFVGGGANSITTVGPQLFTILIRHLPKGTRLRNVQLAKTPDSPKVHLIVAYDAGPQTPTKWHIHLVDKFPSKLPTDEPWWFAELKRIRPQGVVLRAYTGHIEPEIARLLHSWIHATDKGIILTDAISKHDFTEIGVAGRTVRYRGRGFGHQALDGYEIWMARQKAAEQP
jgi:hypothetical protein